MSETSQIDPEDMRNLAISLGRPYQNELGDTVGDVPRNELGAALPQSKPSDLSIPVPQRGTIQGDTAERSRLLSTGAGVDQIYDKVANSDFGHNHPVLGKILGGLGEGIAKAGDIGLSAAAPALAINLPGTEYHHQAQLRNINKQIGDETKEGQEQATTAATQAEVPVREAQAQRAVQKAQAEAPVEITPEQSQALGMPELAGEKVSPAILARLSGQHQVNTTKESTVQDTNQTRKDINQNTVQGREAVVGTQAASKEKIAAGTNAVRQSLGAMRKASGVDKSGETMTTRTMAEMATTVLPRMTAISGEVDRLANELGPAVGRWNELMVNKGGADHPEFAHLDTDLDLLASAIVRTHFGARGGQQYREELRKQFGEAQSPEDLKSRIAAAQDWIQGYADMGQPQAAVPKSSASPQGAAVKEGDTKVNSAGDKVVFKGGKWGPA